MNLKFEKNDIKKVCIVTLSALLYSMGMNIFVKSGNLFPGGFSGISRLLALLCNDFLHIDVSYSVFYFILNGLAAYIVFKKIGKKFMLLSILHFILVSFFTSVLPTIYITEDLLLISVFGGLIGGFAIGLALQNNASSGGMDFVAIYFSIRYNVSTWNYVLIFNAFVLTVAGVLYGWNIALYSIIYQFVSTQVVNTLHKRYKSTELKVITNHPEEICNAVFHTCRHGITRIDCSGAFTNQEHSLLLIDVNTYQLKDVIASIRNADEHAFITIHSVDKIIGNYYQKPLE